MHNTLWQRTMGKQKNMFHFVGYLFRELLLIKMRSFPLQRVHSHSLRA